MAHAALLTDKDLKPIIEGAKFQGCDIQRDDNQGLLTILDPAGAVCLRAMRKGRAGQPWITRFITTENAQWGDPVRPDGR